MMFARYLDIITSPALILRLGLYSDRTIATIDSVLVI